MQSLDDEIITLFLKPKNVAEINATLIRSTDSDERMIGRYIEDSLPANYFSNAGIRTTIEIFAAAAPDPEQVLDAAIRDATKGGESIPSTTFNRRFKGLTNWGLALLQEYFTELREKICGKGKKPTPLGANANAALAALGAAICKLLGLSSPLGMGIAVLVVTNAARIGKNALCKMTTPQELTRYFA